MLSVVYTDCHLAECHLKAPYAECRYAEHRYAKCRGALFTVMLSVVAPMTIFFNVDTHEEIMDFVTPFCK
jgi:hypothetical protein